MKLIMFLRIWLPFAFIITLFAMLVYGAVQQDMRQGANDPQIQMAEDTAASLSHDIALGHLIDLESERIDIAKSLAPFVIVYDKDGKVMNGSGELHDKIPTPPIGVLEASRASGQNRVTWQPEPGVRIAAVATPFYFNEKSSGYVLAGRSLREVEVRESQLTAEVGLAWLFGIAVSFLGALVFVNKKRI